MNMKDITKWNARVSLVYAIGIWTMFGAFGYYQITRPQPSKKDEQQNLSDTIPEEEMKNAATEHVSEERKARGIRSTIVYREGFVPCSERILNFIKSLTKNRGATESQTNQK